MADQPTTIPGLNWIRVANPITLGGVGFVYISAAIFFFASQRLIRSEEVRTTIESFYPELILVGIAVFTGLLGVSLLRASGVAPNPAPVVDRGEWNALEEEIKAGREESITQYVRLRSLTGFTGLFTKLGLTGLPLATIGLTLFFSIMYLRDAQYMDLAKLTLGAFIGSFVQKQVGERQGGGGIVQLPSGEKLKVQSSAPPPAA